MVAEKIIHLARELRSARMSSQRSLRDVAGAADISAAYLQKLERGQVIEPSPKILARLAEALGLSHRKLMELAGYQAPPARPAASGLVERRLASSNLTEAEERSIAAFIDHVVSQRERQ